MNITEGNDLSFAVVALSMTLTLVLTIRANIYLVKNGSISKYLGRVFLSVFFKFVLYLVVAVDDILPGTREFIKIFIQLEVLHDSLQQSSNDLIKLKDQHSNEESVCVSHCVVILTAFYVLHFQTFYILIATRYDVWLGGILKLVDIS